MIGVDFVTWLLLRVTYITYLIIGYNLIIEKQVQGRIRLVFIELSLKNKKLPDFHQTALITN